MWFGWKFLILVGKKVFVVNCVGDFGFLVVIMIMFV